jgi:Zn-dependent protease
MKNPFALHPDDSVHQIGEVFGTPLVVKGFTGLPVVQLLAWLVMFWRARRRYPHKSWDERAGIAVMTTTVLLGSEWGHNLAHAAAAQAVAKPMDAMRVAWGMPLCVYYDINDENVTPKQHILRALGGPVFNALVLPLALITRSFFRPGTAARDMASIAAATNAFLASVSLVPIPVIDGGPILKWSLVSRGRTVQQADEAVRKVDGVLGVLLSLGSLVALKLRRYGSGAFLGLMALTSFAIARGWIKEQ